MPAFLLNWKTTVAPIAVSGVAYGLAFAGLWPSFFPALPPIADVWPALFSAISTGFFAVDAKK